MKTPNEDMRSMIELYALGELGEESIPLVEEHLRNNPDALREVDEIKGLMSAIGSQAMVEPSVEVEKATLKSIHDLMSAERETRRRSFASVVGAFFTRPAYSAVAAVLILGLVVAFVVVTHRAEDRPAVADRGNGEEINAIGAAAVKQSFSNYIAQSDEAFEHVLKDDPEAFKIYLSGKGDEYVMEPLAQAMFLLEKDSEVISDESRKALVGDIDSVWKQISDYVETPSRTSYYRIREAITSKDLIRRIGEVEADQAEEGEAQ